MTTPPTSSAADATAAPGLHISFVSDVVCPWCAIGLGSLQIALDRVGNALGPVTLQFEPFELNPQMPHEGEDIVGHLSRKYGLTPEQVAANQANIQARAAAVGVDFQMDRRSRIWNTFDAHRLLHWAGLQGAAQQLALKRGLLGAYFTLGDNPGDAAVLLREVDRAGLDEAAAQAVLASDAYAAEVREQEQTWQQAGINGVPAVIVNHRHLIQGGQPPEVFEQALRQIAAGAA